MSDPSTASGPPQPAVRPSRRWRLSPIWVVPAIAAAIGLALVAKTFLDRGPVIEVSFTSARGIEPGKTDLRFRDVKIGQVRSLRISRDHSHILATIDLNKEARGFAASDSRFWVVRPRFAGANISGLETVLSGVYIGVDGGRSGQSQREFVGLEEPPAVTSDVPGRRYRLRADDIGSLDIGSPVYYHRIPVGHVESYALEADGGHIMLGIFVKAPYDRYVTPGSRFWHASGVDLRIDANGLKVETQSLSTILMGGVAFESPDLRDVSDTSAVAEDGRLFSLAANHADARKAPDGVSITLAMHFSQSVRGLTVGAPVDFRGVEIGQVRSLGIAFDPEIQEYTVPVVVEVYPDRLGVIDPRHPLTQDDDRRSVLADLIRRGLRAQLKTGSLLTGQKYVSFDFYPKAPPVRFDPKLNPPELPTIPGDLEELQKQLQDILTKLNRLPLEQLAGDIHKTLVTLEALESHTDNEVLPEIRDSLRVLQQSMAPDAPLQQDSRATLQNLNAMTRSLKTLTDTLNKQPESLLRGKNGDHQ